MARKNKKNTAPVAAPEAAVETPAPEAKPAKEPKPKATLDTERLAWVVQHARPALSPCLCGCGGTTKTRFVPGHDAKLKSLLAATAEAGSDDAKAALVTFGW